MGSGRERDIDYLNGRRRIVADRSGSLGEFNEEEEMYNAPPIHSSSMPALFSAQNTPHNANIEFRTSRCLALFAYTNTPDDEQGSAAPPHNPTSPFLVLPSYPGPTPIGAVVCVGKVTIGIGGISRTYLINEMPGQSTKLAFAGDSARHGPILVPKYYTPDDTNILLRQYRVGPGGQIVTSEVFSNPQQGDIEAVLAPFPAQAPALTESATNRAAFTVGSAFGTGGTDSKASRRFFATVPTGAAGRGVLIPVQRGSSHAILVGAPTLQFIQNYNFLDPGSGLPAFTGPFPSNTIVPLDDEVDNLVVSSTVAVAGSEIYFEVHFIPGL